MGGFLPLLEAFAAFALTMVALTTAVSTILSILWRGLRFRALGMRHMLISFYRNELERKITNPNVTTLAQFLVDVSYHPVPHEGTADPRVAEVQRALESKCWTNNWWSVASAVESLTPDEFLTRFKAAAVYKDLTPTIPDDTLKERFIAHGQAATDRFTRTSRTGTIVLGFVLAIGLNIDAFALLGRYLSDPKLTEDVLKQQQEILEKAQDNDTTPAQNHVKSEAEEKLDQANQALNLAADALTKITAALPANSSDAEKKSVEDAKKTMEGRAEDVAAAAQELHALADASATASQTVNALRSTLTDLTQAFPIGWTLYPACTLETRDPRCVETLQRVKKRGVIESDLPKGGTEKERAAARAAAERNLTPPAEVYEAIWWTKDHDPAGFYRWAGGIIILGLMLGLGTPFWIEVFNNFMRARDLIANNRKDAAKEEKDKDKDADAAKVAITVAPPAPAASGGRKVY